MTRYAEIEKALRGAREQLFYAPRSLGYEYTILRQINAALALPEDGKVVNAELYEQAIPLADSAARSDIECMCQARQIGWRRLIPERVEYADEVTRAIRYLELREASGEPMPYRVVRDGDKVRFE